MNKSNSLSSNLFHNNIKDFTKKDKKIYKLAFKFFELQGITENDVMIHCQIPNNPKNLSDLYEKMAITAQNKNMSSNVIGLSKYVNILRKKLYDFNVHEISKHFPAGSEKNLLKIIDNILNQTGNSTINKGDLWIDFCKSLISAAHFFAKFENLESFMSMANKLVEDKRTRNALPFLISSEIYGIGLPLACNFLKEIGFIEFGKPDVHLTYIFENLDLVDKYYAAKSKKDYMILKAIQRMAENNNTNAYVIDKIFWLIGSGNFYLINKKIDLKKEEFVNFIKKQ